MRRTPSRLLLVLCAIVLLAQVALGHPSHKKKIAQDGPAGPEWDMLRSFSQRIQETVSRRIGSQHEEADATYQQGANYTLARLRYLMKRRVRMDKALLDVRSQIPLLVARIKAHQTKMMKLNKLLPRLKRRVDAVESRFDALKKQRSKEVELYNHTVQDTEVARQAVRSALDAVKKAQLTRSGQESPVAAKTVASTPSKTSKTSKTSSSPSPSLLQLSENVHSYNTREVGDLMANFTQMISKATSASNPIDLSLLHSFLARLHDSLLRAQQRREELERRSEDFWNTIAPRYTAKINSRLFLFKNITAEVSRRTARVKALSDQVLSLRSRRSVLKEQLQRMTHRIDRKLLFWDSRQAEYETQADQRDMSLQAAGEVLALTDHYRKGASRKPHATTCAELQAMRNVTQDGDYVLRLTPFSRVKMRLYCYRMGTQRPLEFISLAHPNFAVFYDKRLKNGSDCRSQAKQADWTLKGLTTFTKVRVDLVTMRIVQTDFSFAKSRDRFVQFGTAGDCLAWDKTVPDCHKGVFSIDLRGTSFKLQKQLKLVKMGFSSQLKVAQQTRRRVKARCGGWCGMCGPAKGYFVRPALPGKKGKAKANAASTTPTPLTK